MRRCCPTIVGLLAAAMISTVGCQSGGPRLAGLNPFYRPERTSYVTPAKRAVAIRARASQSTGQDTTDQRAIVQELIAPLATEPDPLIRQATLETVAKFNTPVVGRALLAGLSDNDPHVRRVSCRLVGEKRPEGAVEALAVRSQEDDSFDVRVAAADALGQVGADRRSLLPLLEDRDPAMQLAGVEAMRRATGQNLGGDVASYIALAKGETPPTQRPTSVASRATGWLPFN